MAIDSVRFCTAALDRPNGRDARVCARARGRVSIEEKARKASWRTGRYYEAGLTNHPTLHYCTEAFLLVPESRMLRQGGSPLVIASPVVVDLKTSPQQPQRTSDSDVAVSPLVCRLSGRAGRGCPDPNHSLPRDTHL